MPVCECTYVSMHVHVEAWSWLQVFSSVTYLLLHQEGRVSLEPTKWICLASWLQGSCLPTSSVLRWLEGHHSIPAFYVDAGDPNSSCHTWCGNTLLIELSPQPVCEIDYFREHIYTIIEPTVVVSIYNSSTWETWHDCKFEASLDYLARFFLKKPEQ